METPASLHHIALRVQYPRGAQTCDEFAKRYGFTLYATRSTLRELQWVVKSGDIALLISESRDADSVEAEGDELPKVCAAADWFSYAPDASWAAETVYDVCLHVKSVADVLSRMSAVAEVIMPATVVEDERGIVEFAVIKSCVGNVHHTIINKDRYTGEFLPGFTMKIPKPELISSAPLFDAVDHITFCVHKGETPAVLAWYEKRFGMSRFYINRDETEAGYDIDSIKLRLCAMEYWRCAESGLRMPGVSTQFVIGETLDIAVSNQVSLFLKMHGGPGIQHLAFHTKDILHATAEVRKKGVRLVRPPLPYYKEPQKQAEILAAGQSIEQLQEAGLLLDSAADAEARSDSYLLQVFSEQLFESNLFFIELIQRHKARGFGEGNISALFRAMQSHLDNEKQLELKDAISPPPM